MVVTLELPPEKVAGTTWPQSDYNQTSMGIQCYDQRRNFEKVFICHGILHDASVKPEKRLEQLLAG